MGSGTNPFLVPCRDVCLCNIVPCSSYRDVCLCNSRALQLLQAAAPQLSLLPLSPLTVRPSPLHRSRAARGRPVWDWGRFQLPLSPRPGWSLPPPPWGRQRVTTSGGKRRGQRDRVGGTSPRAAFLSGLAASADSTPHREFCLPAGETFPSRMLPLSLPWLQKLRRKFFPLRAARPWPRLPRAAGAPSLAAPTAGRGWGTLSCREVSLPMAGLQTHGH